MDTSKKIKLTLTAAIVVGVAVIAGVLVNHFRKAAEEPQRIFDALPDGANVSIGKFRQTASRDGKNEWELNAKAAHYMDKDKQAVLEEISMTFFLDNDQQVLLTADHGTFKTDTQNVKVTGRVELTSDDVTLTTETLQYRHDSRLLWTDTPVAIDGETFQLQAKQMQLDLKAQKTVFEGNVRGNFDEDVSM